MSHDAVIPNERWALFLDVDGTLLELAETPDSVYVPAHLKSLLTELSSRLDGALALVSGRTIANLDELFFPLRFCASGVHGAERREANGITMRAQLDTSKLIPVREELAVFVRSHEGLLLEDKSFALAVHCRLAPHLDEAVRDKVQSVVTRLGNDYMLQPGKRVYEVRPRAWSKGSSVDAFLTKPPFLDRTPVYVGDDLTDEDAFETVNRLGGISVRVGEMTNTRAAFRLPSVADVHAWLHEAPSRTPLLRAKEYAPA
jgi:trehalose 6-phosphate phosphatase